MAPTPIDAVCPNCKACFKATPKRTFLGFQRLVCPECKKDVVYPLTGGYRTTYWVLFVFMVLAMIGSFARGEFGVPGGLGIAVAIALIRDWSIKNRVAARETEAKLEVSLDPLILAAADGNDDLVQSLIDAGTLPDVAGPDGQTALMLAARNGHLSTARLLLDRGSSFQATTKSGSSAEAIALKFGHDDVVALIRDRAAAGHSQVLR